MRHLLAAASLVALAACASEPGSSSDLPVLDQLPQWITGLPGDGPLFAVSAVQQEPQLPGYAGNNNASPLLAATHADQICTLGHRRLAQETAPGDPVPLTVWRVRCNSYRPSL